MTALLERARAVADRTRANSTGTPAVRAAAIAIGLVVGYLVLDRVLPKHLPIGVVILGLVFGSFYALTAIGLVLIYRANRVINFAQAEFGSVAAVLAIEFKLQLHMNYFLAIFLGLVIAAGTGALIQIAVIRRFRNAPRLILAVATIGIAQILAGLATLIPVLWQGLGSGQFATPFTARLTIDPVIFNANHLVAMVTVPLVMLAVIAFLRFTDYGVVIRAAAENGDRASLLGVPVPRLSTIVWAIAAVLSALAVLLRIPILGFTSFLSVSGAGNALLLRTLAAAVIGRMENLPRTVIAALGIGVFQQAADWQVARTTIVDAMLVVIILVALLLQKGFFARAAETGISTWKAIKEVRPIPEELRALPEVRWVFRTLKIALLVFAVTLPLWARESQEAAASLVLIYAMVAVSLLVLTGWAGHMSLGQFALAGFGGATTSILYGRHHWDFTAALLAGVVVSAAVALIIGVPALRVRGPYLAVTTLAFAVTAQTYFLAGRYFPWFVQEHIDRPALWSRLPLDQDWQVYLFALGSFLILLWVTRNLRNSHIGRALIAVRDNEVTAESVTMNTTRLKLTAFLISGAMAGFAGGIYVLQQNGLHTDSFDATVSIKLFSMVVIGGLGSLPGAVLGAVYVRGAEIFLPPGWTLIASGFGILLLLMFVPQGLGGAVYGIRDAYLRRVAQRRGILVPSLLADKRQAAEDAPVAIGTALGGLAAAASPTAGNGTAAAPTAAAPDAGSGSPRDGTSDEPPDAPGQDRVLTRSR